MSLFSCLCVCECVCRCVPGGPPPAAPALGRPRRVGGIYNLGCQKFIFHIMYGLLGTFPIEIVRSIRIYHYFKTKKIGLFFPFLAYFFRVIWRGFWIIRDIFKSSRRIFKIPTVMDRTH